MRKWTDMQIRDLIAGMLARQAKGFRVSAATAPLVIEALGALLAQRSRMQWPCTVEEVDGSETAIECLVTTADMGLAIAAYEHAVRRAPNARLMMRQGGRIMRRSYETTEAAQPEG